MLRKSFALLFALLFLVAWKPGDVFVDDATETTYVVNEVLGSGTFGEVARVTRSRKDGPTEEIALKIIHPEKKERPLTGYRFLLGKSPSGLPTGLLPFEKDVALSRGGEKFLAVPMPLAEAVGKQRENYRVDMTRDPETLRARLKMMEGFMHDGIRSLQHLQEMGVAIGDIKPANLFVRNGHLEFGDFDGAVEIGKQENVTTMQYRAPEVERTGLSSPTSDLYGFGATLFAMMFGEDPTTDYIVVKQGVRRRNITVALFRKYLLGDGGPVAADIRGVFADLEKKPGLDEEDRQRIRRLEAFIESATDHDESRRDRGMKTLAGAKPLYDALNKKKGGFFAAVCRKFGAI